MTERSLHHPGRWLWLLLSIPVLIGLFRLHLDVEIFNLLPSDVPAVRGLIIHQQNFANARELILTVQGPTPEEAETWARAIADALRAETNLISSVLWQPPWLEHPEWSAELIAYLWFNAPPPALRDLANRLSPSNLLDIASAAREQLATSMSPGDIARLSYDPFGFTELPASVSAAAPSFAQGQEGFSSPDGTFRILFVESKTDLPTYEECARWLASVKAVVKSASPPTASIGYTGRPGFVAEIAHQMRNDIALSVGLTAVIIAILFWLAHHRLKPMLWLLTLLALILGSTLALGGLIFGAINVISMGFAAILLGLAVDYAVVHYQEALAKPELTVPQIRHAIAPSILWAAVTTISAFLVLNFGGLPGLAQLGTLVAVGVTLAALIMIFEFLPPLFPDRNRDQPDSPKLEPHTTSEAPSDSVLNRKPGSILESEGRSPKYLVAFASAFGLIAIVLTILTVKGLPGIDPTAEPLRPRKSTAFAALNQVQRLLTHDREPLWVIVRGTNELQVAQRLAQIQPALDNAVANRSIESYTLPTQLWPNPVAQAANREVALELARQRNACHRAALEAGFSTNALALTDSILATWSTMATIPGVVWPTNRMSQWILDKVAVRTPTNLYALALVTPAPLKKGDPASRQFSALAGQLNTGNSWFTGWELLGSSIFSRVKQNFWRVLIPMAALVLLSLWFAFRRPLEIFLSLGVLVLSCLSLLAVMRLAGWSWNLLNLMAIPLILGTGVDYSIFMLLGLRRCHGDLHLAYRAVGRALLLCGGTAVTGFGSLGFSSNAGMASLGQVCAVGIGFNMLLGIFILPRFWEALVGKQMHASLP